MWVTHLIHHYEAIANWVRQPEKTKWKKASFIIWEEQPTNTFILDSAGCKQKNEANTELHWPDAEI